MGDGTLGLRIARPADLEELTALAALTFPLACPPSSTPEAIAAHVAAKLNPTVLASWMSREDCTLMVAESDGRLAAYALVVTGPCADTMAAASLQRTGIDVATIHELSKIYALPGVHGGGVAARLLEAVIGAAAARHGELPVWLGTNDENLRAQAFYRRHHFAVVGHRTFHVGGRDESDVVMVRTEPASAKLT